MANLTILTDVFAEGCSGQRLDITLLDPATGNTINTATVSAATATLRSLDTGATVFASANVLPTAPSSRGSFPGNGVFRITFTAADLAAVGHRELQRRGLVLELVHSGDKALVHEVQFPLMNVS